MAVAAAQEPIGVTTDNATSSPKTFPLNVTAGNLIIVKSARYANGANTAFVTGNCTQTGGTATLGTITLDKQANVNSANPTQAGVWSVPVTGTGTLTIAVAGPAGSFYLTDADEYSGTDVSSSRVDGTPNSGTSLTGTSPATTGNTTTAAGGIFCVILAPDFGGANLNSVVGGGFTKLSGQIDGTTHQTGETDRLIVSTGTTTQGSWTQTTTALNGWAAVIVAYKAAGGGGGRTLFVQSALDGLGSNGPKQFNPSLGYHRHPSISLEAYRRDRAIAHRRFLDAVRRSA